MRHKTTALALLLVGLAAAYGWQLAPDEQIAMVWNVAQGLWPVFLLALIAATYRTREVAAVCALLSVFGLMVAGCSLAFMIRPWPILPGDERCSAGLNYPLGLLGAVIALALVVAIIREKK